VSAIGGKLPARLPRTRSVRLGILNLLLVAGVAGAGVAAYLTVGTSGSTTSSVTRTATAARGVVLSTISATGELQPAAEISVNFASSGELVAVSVKAGQHVRKGQVLGRIDTTGAQQAVRQAETSLANAQAQYETTVTGETPQQRAQDALSVTQARMSVTQARRSVTTAEASLAATRQSVALDKQTSAASIAQAKRQLGIDQGQQQVDLAQRAKDRVPYPTVDAAQAAVDADQSQLANDQSRQHADQMTQLDAQNQQSNDQASLSAAQTAHSNSEIGKFTAALNQDRLTLQGLQTTLSADSYAISQDQSKLGKDQGYLSALQADEQKIRADELKIAQDRQAIESAQRNATATAQKDAQSLASAQQQIASARQQVVSAQLSVRSTRASNALKQAPPTAAQLASARASVVQAQIALENARTALAETTLRAPIAGVVAALNGTVGTQTSGGGNSVVSSSSSSSGAGSGSGSGSAGYVTLTKVSGMQVLASFSETDASKLRVGQAATVTVDALPNRQLAAHVLAIASTATTSSNVVTYDVTFALERTAAQLKPGMTANVDVIVSEQDNVVHVPTAAVRGSGRNSTVTVLRNGQQASVPVVVGLQGDSSTAILSGLEAGDTVVLPTVSISSSGTTGTAGSSTIGGARGGRGGVFFGGGFGG
jgi:multidrug efflux pump subunit AcrA (membrane-fusion protein)